ncbi:unnamed protein product [Ambrosiozyma monospora]|uniref:Unnamed protein product n=1 Tax=Ambrosiozyma monospora TaxID=43982 RepID=A0ACB5T6Z9_AMBMO|nr:unnamed protein product [Ambrosiozyma monospora]
MKFGKGSVFKYFEDIDPVMELMDTFEWDSKNLPKFKGPFGCFVVDSAHLLRSNYGVSRLTMKNGSGVDDGPVCLDSEPKVGHSSHLRSMMVQPAEARHGNVAVDNDGLEKDQLIPRNIWIHPRLQIDALLTYKSIVGDAEASSDDWDKVQETIFPEFYHKPYQNRIVDNFNTTWEMYGVTIRQRIREYLVAIDDPQKNIPDDKLTFKMIMEAQKTEDLIRTFTKTCHNMMCLSCKKSLLDNIVSPIIYKLMGEMYISDPYTGMGVPGDQRTAADFHDMDDSNFKEFCKMIRQELASSALSIASFNQYRILFNDFGLYEGSKNYLKCCLAFRGLSMSYLTQIIQIITIECNDTDPLKVRNTQTLNRLVSVGMIKEFMLCLILGIKQDEMLNVIHNYNALYSFTNQVVQYIKTLNCQDPQLDEILLWFKYMFVFFRSTSKIDAMNYAFGGDKEVFADLNESYNLSKNFNFDDSFKPEEFTKIEIKPVESHSDENLQSLDETGRRHERNYSHSSNSESNGGRGIDSDASDEDSDSDSYPGLDGSVKALNIPKRLSERPDIADKPPKSFTVNFNFAGYSSDEEDEDGDYSDEERASSSSTTNNQHSNIVDRLTGLTFYPSKVPYKKREQLYETGEKLVDIRGLISNSEQEQEHGSHVWSVEISYGIPHSLLELLHRTIKCTDHRNWFIRNKVFPRNFPKICCDLEEDLIHWKLPWNLFSKAPDFDIDTTIGASGHPERDSGGINRNGPNDADENGQKFHN